VYPGLRHLLGGELFDDFALEYVHARPSRSYTLRTLAAGLPDYLAATRPDAGGVAESWVDLMIDLARLEVTVAEVYDAHGAEDMRIPDVIPAVADAELLACIAEPVECLRLIRSSFAVGPYLSAIRRGEDPDLPPAGNTFLAVSRRDYVVTLTALDRSEYTLLDQLVRGVRIGRAASTAGIGHAEAWRLVRRWTAAGCFVSRFQSFASDNREESMTP
jgi:Putative DNA-binding domain